MTDYQSILLRLLSKSLFNQPFNQLETDWLEVLKEARDQVVVQLAYNALDKERLTSKEANEWQQAMYADVAKNVRVFHNHQLLHKWMTEEKISYVILKGAASASYYPIPTYRSMGDVDFLVNGQDLEKAGEALEKQGLKSWEKEHDTHIVYRASGMHYEMHFNIAGTPHGAAGNLVREFTKDIFEKAELEHVGEGVIVLPSIFHHGLILLLHTCHHLTGEGVGLRHLCDWAVFENKLSNGAFIELFEEKLKKLGLWHFAQILTRVSIEYLGAEEREWAVCDKETTAALIEDILTGGNFGKKDSNRIIQKMIISNRGKDGVGHTSIIRQLIQSGNDVVYENWPSARKRKMLIPVGWLYFGLRRFFRELTKKRKKTDVSVVLSGASKRRELYKRFKLYESEKTP